MKNNLKRIMSFFLCIGCLFGVVSCGGPMSESTVPKNDVSKEEEQQPPHEDESDVTLPQETYQALYDKFLNYTSVAVLKEHSNYLSCTTAETLVEQALDKAFNKTFEDVLAQLGTPQFFSYGINMSATSKTKRYYREAFYVVEDVSVLRVVQFNTVIVQKMSVAQLFETIESEWAEAVIEPCEPQKTYAALYEELANRQYMDISDRKDFADVVEVKKIEQTRLFYNVTVSEMISCLGEPHFKQSEENRRPGSSMDPSIYYIYALTDGTVLFVPCFYGHNRIGEPFHLTAEQAIPYLSTMLYF